MVDRCNRCLPRCGVGAGGTSRGPARWTVRSHSVPPDQPCETTSSRDRVERPCRPPSSSQPFFCSKAGATAMSESIQYPGEVPFMRKTVWACFILVMAVVGSSVAAQKLQYPDSKRVDHV